MAMIKCPECGQRISSMAGTCPHCGVAVKGHLRECPECGEWMLDIQDECPECGTAVEPLVQVQLTASVPPVVQEQPKPKKSHTLLWICFFLLIMIGGGCGWAYYMYQQKMIEQQAYMEVMETYNPDFYQDFLDRYPTSSYVKEITARMMQLRKEQQVWLKVAESTDVQTLRDFADRNPTSPFLAECMDRIDSLDWEAASTSGSDVAVERYIKAHPEGKYIDQASDRMNTLARERLSESDILLIQSNVESFLTCMSKNDLRNVTSLLAIDQNSRGIKFRGATESTPEDIMAWTQQKKEKDVIGIHYQIEGDVQIDKKTVDDAILYQVRCVVKETINRSDPTKPNSATYNMRTILNADKKITEVSL